ncbi:N-6 DNA methylase [Leadbettera azotonutricia]|uniref:site-specific DNA-methyltransferase (adenine-specific) n=1 Tax=Leadbettera azotonutricia (strain ATCC BAA-888 / DSM 13862 / ZAS-9) TaxID=545695 RepID=F5YB75_LEAAZ|nr:N-6 DNA methylase [Leadbettera azotonutricia]AEF82274.1 putative type II dna modification enzyme [Leadbettera azotonutricia ZAS-9]
MENLLKKEQIGEKLGISLATVNNWIKTQVIPPPDVSDQYSQSAFASIINKIKDEPSRLNSRANRSLLEKKYICYLGITEKSRKLLLNNIVREFEMHELSLSDGVLALVLATLRTNKIIDNDWQVNKDTRLDSFLSAWIAESKNIDLVKALYSKFEITNKNDDILGAFYQSIQSISQKSTFGSYYTPSKLLKEINIPKDKTILDPCCGSGGILIGILTKEHDPSKIFARDVDELALKICFINLVLYFNDKNLSAHIIKQDIAFADSEDFHFASAGQKQEFDFIVTNPPWGSKWTKSQKECLLKLYPEIKTNEIYSIALYNAMTMLKSNGKLYYFLPHSFLNVAAHHNIRYCILNNDNKISIKLLGNVFKDVLSESILLHIEAGRKDNNIHIKDKDGNIYQLSKNDIISPDYIISANINDYDSILINKMYNTEHVDLKNNASFALGIVTGNNARYILQNSMKNSEPIFRGKDIQKYYYESPQCHIVFSPGCYQQIAPIEFYRQKKIAYRFISDTLICTLDCGNALLLNSANLFIPHNYPMESIVGLLNSDIYSFIYKKKFHSRKILKSHLQDLPLPILTAKEHKNIYAMYRKMILKEKNTQGFQENIDKIIRGYFSIDDEQYGYIKGELNGDTLTIKALRNG